MKYNVTNPTVTPRVLHDVDNRAKLIPPGEMRVVDLHDHDAERLMGAKGDEVKLKPVESPRAPDPIETKSVKK